MTGKVYIPRYIAEDFVFGMCDKTTDPPTMTINEYSNLDNSVKLRLLYCPEFQELNPMIFSSENKAPIKKIQMRNDLGYPRHCIGCKADPPELSDLTNDSKIKFCVRELRWLFENYPHIKDLNNQLSSVIVRVYENIIGSGIPLPSTEHHLQKLRRMNPDDQLKFLRQTLVTKLRPIPDRTIDEDLLLRTLEQN